MLVAEQGTTVGQLALGQLESQEGQMAVAQVGAQLEPMVKQEPRMALKAEQLSLIHI
jgi:hypothetical protein